MSFSADITKWVNKTNGFMGKSKREIVFKLFSDVINESPVDSGQFKAAWVASFGVPSTSTPPISNDSLAQLNQITEEQGVDFLANNLPYAMRLEFGYSDQAPNGMVRRAIRRLKRIAASEGWK